MRMQLLIPLLLLGTVTSVTVMRHHHKNHRNLNSRIRHRTQYTHQDHSLPSPRFRSARPAQANGPALGAYSLVEDALQHGHANQLAAYPRFKSKAPFNGGDNPERKTISMYGTGDGTGDGDYPPDGDNATDVPAENGASGSVNGSKIYRVIPGEETGMKMEPMPGMHDPTIYVRSPDKYGAAARQTNGYVRESQLTSIDKITDAIDASEDRIKGLKLRVVEKQNFLDSLRKRERILDSDVAQDQGAVRNLLNHIDALDLRLTRLKKENELKVLSAMYDNYTSKAVNLEGQAAGLSNARDALFNKIQTMHNTIGGLRQREDANARMAVDGDDDVLQTYGYAGALKERKESLQDEMTRQMQQMSLQQNLLQQQLSLISGGNSTASSGSGSAKGSGSGK